MSGFIKHWNGGNPDEMLGGKCLSYQIMKSSDGFDRGSLSVLRPGAISVGSTGTGGQAQAGTIALGKTMPGRSMMYCTSFSQQRAEGNSTIWSAEYTGFADGTELAKVSLLDPVGGGARVSTGSVIREEHFPAGGNVEVDGFPTSTNSLAVRFNNVIWTCSMAWVSNEKAGFVGVKGSGGTLGFSPPVGNPPDGVDGPWAGTFPAVRVFPHGWVLRSLRQQQVADGLPLFLCEASWQWEWKYQPAIIS